MQAIFGRVIFAQGFFEVIISFFFILVLVTPVYANVVPILGCWSLLKSGLANTLRTGGFQRIPTTLHEAAWNHYGPVSSRIYASSRHSLLSPSRRLMPTVPKHSYKVEGSNGNTTKSVRNKLQTVETQPFLGVLFLPFFWKSTYSVPPHLWSWQNNNSDACITQPLLRSRNSEP